MAAFAAILKLCAAVFDGSDIAVGLAHGENQGVGGASVDNIVAAGRRITKSTKYARREKGGGQREQTNDGPEFHVEHLHQGAPRILKVGDLRAMCLAGRTATSSHGSGAKHISTYHEYSLRGRSSQVSAFVKGRVLPKPISAETAIGGIGFEFRDLSRS